VRKNAALLFAFLLFPLASFALSEVDAIHADRLPQETAVLAALDDVRQLEPYCYSYTPDWRYSIAKEEVATRIGKDLGFLTLALKDYPDNAELLLLTGLAARFAYNLDAPGSYETALNALALRCARPLVSRHATLPDCQAQYWSRGNAEHREQPLLGSTAGRLLG